MAAHLFLGHLFGLHPLEQRYADINIADRPFEAILGWMSEQTSAGSFNPWLSADLGSWLERYWASRTQPDAGYVGDFELASRLCDRTLDPLLSQRISNSPNTETAQLISHSSLNERLFQATPNTCRQLIQEILPTLRVLDPACGSGNLLAAINQRLLDIFSVLTGYTQQSQDAQLKIWQSSLLDQNYLDQNYSDQKLFNRQQFGTHPSALNPPREGNPAAADIRNKHFDQSSNPGVQKTISTALTFRQVR